MKERWEEEQKLKLETQPQEKISVESFPEHSMPPMLLFTPSPSEEKTGHVETFPQAESSLPPILLTPVHPQEGQHHQRGFRKKGHEQVYF